MRLTPGKSGRGLSLSIVPQWGQTESATDRLWPAGSPRGLGLEPGAQNQGRLALQAGYGFWVGPDQGVLTPYAGMTLGGGASRTVHGGARWKLGQDVQMNIEAVRATRDDKHSVELWTRALLRF